MRTIKVEGVPIVNVIAVLLVSISMTIRNRRISKMYGKLGVIKTYGEKSLFIVGDTIIPDIGDWLFKRLGKIVDVNISDRHFQITDIAEE